ncbi:MAG: asparagine synthase (glutamine-hydrolyzing) [Candidatus Marinimicrobia bacterium]|nr:asparagine synthase (glutamine-hydrolyzing) [Candidatus Neomarinimicrobiota bacterium]
MCGIAGKIYYDRQRSVAESDLHAMADCLIHRGPDGEGILLNNNVGFAMRRLVVIDPKTGNQPIYNEDGSIGVVQNGEIYNYKEVRDELRSKGHKFETESDTEVIVHAYEEYGKDCPKHLNGQFAFAINDSKTKTQFLARDRLGIKPLFWYSDSDKFMFASEVKSLIQDDDFPAALDEEGVWDYFSFGYVPTPKSIFKGLNKLEPGCSLTLKDGKITIDRYWELESNEESEISDETELLSILEGLLQKSVEERLVSDVPFGAFLSGGVDSSLVVALMAKSMNLPVKTFSIGFEEFGYNELDKARIVSKLFKTEHHEYIVKADAVDILPKLAIQYDEPFADSSALPTYYLSKMAREEVTMCLSGDGGDELFGGYNRYMPYSNGGRGELPGIFKLPARIISNLIPFGTRGKNRLRWLGMNPFERYIDQMSFYPNQIKHQLFSDAFLNGSAKINSYDKLRRYYKGTENRDLFTRVSNLDIHSYLVDNNLQKIDRASMLNSLEVRVPLIDYRVAEFAISMSSNFKIRGSTKKYLLRKLAAKYLPEEIFKQSKKGFSIPVAQWLRGDMKMFSYDLLFDGKMKARGIFNMKFIDKVWRRHQTGKEDMSSRIWALNTFELWNRTWIDNNAA